jgi:hypothetical protein
MANRWIKKGILRIHLEERKSDKEKQKEEKSDTLAATSDFPK